MCALETLTLLVILFCISFIYYKHIFTYWERKNVIVPTRKSLIINMGKENLGLIIKDDYTNLKRCGINRYFGYYLFGKPFFIPMDLELIKNITTRDFYYFNSNGTYINEDQPIMTNLFSLERDRWRRLRQKLTPAFTSGKMKMMFETRVNTGDPMVKHINGLVKRNEPISIREILERFTVDVIGSCAFGIDCNSFENSESEFGKHLNRVFNPNAWDMIKNFMSLSWPNLSRKLGIVMLPREIETFFTKIVSEVVDYREKNNVSRKDALQLFIELKNSHEADKDQIEFGITQILAQSFLFFIGGSETSTSTMTFAMFEMCKNEIIQDNVRKEVQEVLMKYNGQYTYEGVANMKYLNQVVEETLRKYPILPLICKKCTHNYDVPNSDLVIEKDTLIFLPVYAIQHDPEYYPDPEKFDPDRFSDGNKESRVPFTFLTFGEGPRTCLGMRFGKLQTKIGLMHLLNNFKFSLSDKTPTNNGIHKTFLLRLKHDIWVNAVPL